MELLKKIFSSGEQALPKETSTTEVKDPLLKNLEGFSQDMGTLIYKHKVVPSSNVERDFQKIKEDLDNLEVLYVQDFETAKVLSRKIAARLYLLTL